MICARLRKWLVVDDLLVWSSIKDRCFPSFGHSFLRLAQDNHLLSSTKL